EKAHRRERGRPGRAKSRRRIAQRYDARKHTGTIAERPAERRAAVVSRSDTTRESTPERSRSARPSEEPPSYRAAIRREKAHRNDRGPAARVRTLGAPPRLSGDAAGDVGVLVQVVAGADPVVPVGDRQRDVGVHPSADQP